MRCLPLAFTLLLPLAGCFSDPGATPCDAGSLHCECFGVGECQQGLVCQVGVCVAAAGSTGSTGSDVGSSGTETSGGTAGPTSESTEPPTSAEESTSTTVEPSTSEGSSTGPAATCDNGVLDPGEMCDRGAGCTDCELDSFACNPLNDAGCSDGTHCTYLENSTFACLISPPDPGPVDAECDDLFNGNACSGGLTCLLDCASFCCTPWCDVAGLYAPCPQNMVCSGFWLEPSQYLGLDWLGVCVRT